MVPAPLAPGHEHRERARAGDQDRRERAEPVARERLRDQRLCVRALVEDDPGEDTRRDEARRSATNAAKPRRIHHGTSTLPSSATPDAPSSASVGESASQSTFGVGITASPRWGLPRSPAPPRASPGTSGPVIEAGQAERKRMRRDQGNDDPELAVTQVGRVLPHVEAARAVQHGRDQPQHVHRREHDRAGADDRPAPAGAVRRRRGSGTHRRR